MSNDRRLRALVAALAVAGVVVGLAAPANAVPPKRTPVPMITSSPASPTNATSASFSFSDANTAAVFTCSLDGSAFRACKSPVSYAGPLAARTHTFTVRAQVPTWRAASASRSWTIDLTPPDAPVLSAVPQITNASIAPTFTVLAIDLLRFECSVDAAPWATCLSGSAVTVGTDGRHTLDVRAVDKAGNPGPATSVSWLRDTVAPTPFVTTGPASSVQSTSATFTFDSDDTSASYTCGLDGVWQACTSPNPDPITKLRSTTYSGLTASSGGTPHTFAVRVTDLAGNTATSAPYTWRAFTAAPPVSLSWTTPGNLPQSVTSIAVALLEFTATNQTTLDCSLDGAAPTACTGSVTLSALADGLHTFAVVADRNLASRQALSITWQVDSTPPGAPSLFGPNLHGPASRTNQTSITIQVVPSNIADSLTCALQVDGGAPSHVACSLLVPVQLTGLADATYTLLVTESDRAGNVAPLSLTWTVDTVAPGIGVSTPATVTAPAVVDVSEAATVTGASPQLRLATGATIPTAMSCLTDAGAPTSCGGYEVRHVRLTPVAPLVPGESYVVVVNGSGIAPLTDVAGNAAAAVSVPFRAATVVQEDSRALRQSWKRVATSAAKGGSYVVERTAGARAAWSFRGTGFTTYLMAGPTFGVAAVYVDGRLRATYNQYAASLRTIPRRITGLAAAGHVVYVVVTGKKAKAAKATDVGVDGFVVGSTLVATPALTMTWSRVRVSTASGYYRSRTVTGGASMSLVFKGTGITWSRSTGPAYGLAVVYVDGVKRATVDSWTSVNRERVPFTITGLSNARHTIVVTALGTKRAASKGTLVTLDLLNVR